jgi:hypothetical protein
VAWTFVALACAAGARAELPGGAAIEDQIQLVVREREVIALDAAGGFGTREALDRGEAVTSHFARGRVAVAVTERRVLAVAIGSASFQDARLRRGERLLEPPLLGARVAVVLTSVRAIGFDGGSGNLVETSLGPRERVMRRAVGGSVAAVVTDRRALGLSPFAGGWFEAKLALGEGEGTLAATGNFATLTTPSRILTFLAPTGVWQERALR